MGLEAQRPESLLLVTPARLVQLSTRPRNHPRGCIRKINSYDLVVAKGGAGRARARGGYAKGAARRRQILDAAIAVFARRGAGRTSLRAIAQDVGVTHAALIHHFGSLERLLVAVYLESSRRLASARQVSAEASPVEVMRLVAESNRQVPGMVQLYTSLVAWAIEDGHQAATIFAADWFARVRNSLADRVLRSQAAGEIRPELDADQVSALIVAASDGLQTQWLLDPAVDQVGALALLDRLLSDATTNMTGGARSG